MKKRIAYWALYDFANSMVLIAFLFYFSQWLVVDQGKPAWWYNGALIIASVLFVLAAPYLSKKIDVTGKKIGGLRLSSALTFIFHLAVALMAATTDGKEAIITILYTLAIFSYLICFLYFTPMLIDLSVPENRSRISGIGQGANSIGQVVGILLVLPFVNGITLFGDPGRAQALLPATIVFGLLALPMLIFYKEGNSGAGNNGRGYLGVKEMFKAVFSYKPLALLFLAYFLFSDALITFANNFPLYLETVYQASDTTKSLLTAAILVLAAVGAIVFGKIGDRVGDLKVLKKIILVWCVLFVLMAFVTSFKIAVPIFIIAGLFYGPVWAVSRSLVGTYSPPGLLASSYSYYVVAERFASFLGPAIWSVCLIAVGESTLGYQTALGAMAVMMVAGYFVLTKIKV